MPLATRLAKVWRKLAGRHPLDDRGGFVGSHKFHDTRAGVGGPDGYGHVNVDRDFKKPRS